jgi:hypothetical protein
MVHAPWRPIEPSEGVVRGDERLEHRSDRLPPAFRGLRLSRNARKTPYAASGVRPVRGPNPRCARARARDKAGGERCVRLLQMRDPHDRSHRRPPPPRGRHLTRIPARSVRGPGRGRQWIRCTERGRRTGAEAPRSRCMDDRRNAWARTCSTRTRAAHQRAVVPNRLPHR